MNEALRLALRPLQAETFAPYGEVIDAAAATRVFPINQGGATRFHALAPVEVDAQGRAVISLLRARPQALPLRLRLLERHPLGSQAFVPLSPANWLVVVASDPARPQAFRVGPGQGINYRRGTWHHPLILLDAECDFLVVDRDGPGDNCEEVGLAREWWLGADAS